MTYNFIPIDRIFTKLSRELTMDIPEGDVIEMCGEALEFIGANKNYEEAVSFIEVRNHQCELPKGLHNIIQIARNNNWSKSQSCSPEAVIEETTPVRCDGIPVALDCNGTPIHCYELAYYRPFFDLRLEVNGWSNSAYYKRSFTPVRLSTNTLFNSIVCKDLRNIVNTSKDEYTIIAGKYARFSFKTGHVAIAYLRQIVDTETGYPLVPDNISCTTAIVKYITLKTTEKQFYAGREGADRRVQKAEADWQWYCKQAGNVGFMLNGIDEHQNLLDQRSYLIPQHNRYYGFFGNLNAPNNTLYGGRARSINSGRILDAESDEIIINNITEVNNYNDSEGELIDNEW